MLMSGRLSSKIIPMMFVSKILVWFIHLSFVPLCITINLLFFFIISSSRHHNLRLVTFSTSFVGLVAA